MTIPESAGVINESAVVPRGPESPQLELGVVGWPGDENVAGLGTSDNDGRTLVKVTLHRGAQPGDEPKPGEASGYQVSVRATGPLYHVPAKGTEVVVAFPSGFGMAPAAGLLLCTTGATPEIQFSATKAKLDVGPDADLVLKGRSATLCIYNPDDPTSVEDFVSLSPEGGIQATNRFGFGFHVDKDAVTMFAPGDDGDAKTIVRLTAEQLTLANKNPGGAPCSITLKDLEICFAGLVTNSYTPGANIGALATAATPAMVGTGGAATWAAWLTALGTWATSVSAAFAAATPSVTVVFPPMPPPPCAPSVTVNVQP